MNTQGVILTHAVLIGLTSLIPVPFVDDWIGNVFRRCLVYELGKAHGQMFTDDQLTLLTTADKRSFLGGCLYTLLVYPTKKILRKLFFIVEWPRAIHQVSLAYYDGYLLDYALTQGWYTPGDPQAAAALRAAIQRTRTGANTKLVQQTVKTYFNNSKALVLGAAQQLYETLGGEALRRNRSRLRTLLHPRQAELEPPPAAPTPTERTDLITLVLNLQAAILALPQDHFDGLQQRLAQELHQPGAATASLAGDQQTTVGF